MGGGASMPPVPAIPEPPKASDEAIAKAAELERLRRRKAKGRESTILAGELGAYRPDGGDGQTKPRTLLGGQ